MARSNFQRAKLLHYAESKPYSWYTFPSVMRTSNLVLRHTMFQISQSIAIDERELQEEFVLSSGPGGQRVNKVATAVKLRFDVVHSPSLPEDVRGRLIRLAGKRINEDGVIVIDARRFRSQDRNRQDARDRLADLIRKAAERPKSRRKTYPTATSKARRLAQKYRRGKIKQGRQTPSQDTDG